jgi:hypothetical protein
MQRRRDDHRTAGSFVLDEAARSGRVPGRLLARVVSDFAYSYRMSAADQLSVLTALSDDAGIAAEVRTEAV